MCFCVFVFSVCGRVSWHLVRNHLNNTFKTSKPTVWSNSTKSRSAAGGKEAAARLPVEVRSCCSCCSCCSCSCCSCCSVVVVVPVVVPVVLVLVLLLVLLSVCVWCFDQLLWPVWPSNAQTTSTTTTTLNNNNNNNNSKQQQL